ncbi:hypothetical protein SLNWT_2689 [Streptomyces albus]|uniref:Uncharacterized protein n=1 Tax=Streptomyces albus (strain ATCC 21838 / DSM 41398 / FERM P-419 / JCM 4703 / NBRC 107858) TaxID=1081613 RepID=A0A0B5EUZ7_STRA4|nr:hypothetical protein SLNWT_2689 [Streptomyces albus]
MYGEAVSGHLAPARQASPDLARPRPASCKDAENGPPGSLPRPAAPGPPRVREVRTVRAQFTAPAAQPPYRRGRMTPPRGTAEAPHRVVDPGDPAPRTQETRHHEALREPSLRRLSDVHQGADARAPAPGPERPSRTCTGSPAGARPRPRPC